MNNLKNLTNDELEKKSFHVIEVNKIREYCDPLACWMDIEKPITKKEVLACVKAGNAELMETPDIFDSLYHKRQPMTVEETRQAHIKKIAFFVVNDSNKAIDMDVGIPDLNAYVSYMVQDGNHRLAGAIIRGDKTINVNISGSESYAKELGLWNPNNYLVELQERWMKEYEERQKLEGSKKFLLPASLKM